MQNFKKVRNVDPPLIYLSAPFLTSSQIQLFSAEPNLKVSHDTSFYRNINIPT